MVVSQQQVEIPAPSLRWYRVVLAGQGGIDVRQSIQASSPDRALRAVMRMYRLSYTADAFIWRLFSQCGPSRRWNVRCRLPRVLMLAR